MNYFTLSEAARRYDSYRPKVHSIILDWLAASGCPSSYGAAIDIACGTGDSSVPLKSISQELLCIDSSIEMLEYAKRKELDTQLSKLEDFKSDKKFDLISTCMAFHWFETEQAIAKYKAISNNGAIWLIYNFAFAGSDSNDEFNEWFRNIYLSRYPSPPRGKYSKVIPKGTPNIEVLAENNGSLTISLNNQSCISYFSTQSNFEAAVRAGNSYEAIVEDLESTIPLTQKYEDFIYQYSYGIYKYLEN